MMKEAITLSWKSLALGMALLIPTACQTTESNSTAAGTNTELAASEPTVAAAEASSSARVKETATAEAVEDVAMLSGDEIRKVLVGSTWFSNEPGDSGKEYYREDGQVFGRWVGGRDYRGKWSIGGDSMHFDYAGASYDGRFQVGRSADGSILFYRGGKPEFRGKVLSGNPFGL